MKINKRKQLRELLHVARALLRSMDGVVSSGATTNNTVWHFASYRIYARKYNQLVDAVMQISNLEHGILDIYDIDKLPNIGKTLDSQQKSYFQGVHANLSMLCAYLESKVDVVEISNETRELRGFLMEKLRPAMLNREPKNEKSVQDTVEQILIGRGMQKGVDYDRETGRVKHSGKESVPDFIFLSLSAVLEVKLVKDRNRVSRIVDEINADVLAYSKKYSYLLFLIYDNGGISDIEEFRRDFESDGKIDILVVKH